MTIYAAGVVCWREQQGELEVLLVHREKYKDWSFPKGKQDPGEMLPETAVREMEEETGVRLKLGRKLSVMKYQVPSGEDKEVHYWASKLKPKAWKEAKFKPNDEIAQLQWLSAEQAALALSYEHDRELLDQLISLYEKAELETRSLIILRHAKATPRSDWNKGEATRPLLDDGRLQAKRIVPLIGAYGPKRLISSPWKRCADTVLPYAKKCNKKVILRSQITEFKSKKNPKQARQIVEDVFKDTKNALICTHRPALPEVLKAISNHASNENKASLQAASALKPSDFLVVRLTLEDKPRVVDHEWISLELQKDSLVSK